MNLIGSIAQLSNDEVLTEKVKRLETDIKVFQEELQQSYELIDQLEFEIEEVSVKMKIYKNKNDQIRGRLHTRRKMNFENWAN